jgi:hypothetical protein
MKLFKPALFLLGSLLVINLKAGQPEIGKPADDDFCGIRNTSFQEGEQLNYSVYYSLFGIYVNAGHATISTSLKRLNKRTVYHLVGDGKTSSSYDWITKVNNRYESYVDTVSLQPMRFIRDVHEGNHKKYEVVSFNRAANTAVTPDGVYKVPNCVQDIVSAFFYMRNINFNKYKPDDKIHFSMFLDNEVYNMYIRYIGKEDVKTRYGKFRAIKFRPLLIKGTVFEGGEKMTIWVTDDNNRIPIRVETPLVVGSIKLDMMGYKNLRHPLTSLRNLR